jgi:hypothetical protein
MNQTVRVFLHVLVAAVTMAIGIAFFAMTQLFVSLRPTPQAEATEPPRSVLRPVESDRPLTVLELSCYDPHILRIWHELRHDEEFNDRLRFSTGMLNCSEMLLVKGVDLNGDGNDEILVRGKGPQLCGATGNCGYWVFALTKARVRMLLSASDHTETYELGEEVQPSRSRGYADLILDRHHGAAETSFRTYRFDGIGYGESRCVYERRFPGEGRRKVMTCADLDSRRGY